MYKITTKRNFRGPNRQRAGIVVAPGGEVVTELDDDQLAAIQDDPYLVVEAVKKETSNKESKQATEQASEEKPATKKASK